MTIPCIPRERATKGPFPDDTPDRPRDVLREFATDVSLSARKHFVAYDGPAKQVEASPFTLDADGNLQWTVYEFVEPPEAAVFDIAETAELAIRLVQWRADLITRRAEAMRRWDEMFRAGLIASAEEDELLDIEGTGLPEPPEGAPSA